MCRFLHGNHKKLWKGEKIETRPMISHITHNIPWDLPWEFSQASAIHLSHFLQPSLILDPWQIDLVLTVLLLDLCVNVISYSEKSDVRIWELPAAFSIAAIMDCVPHIPKEFLCRFFPDKFYAKYRLLVDIIKLTAACKE